MGYDRQRSPFATRLFLTCYCVFLLVNILLYSNHLSRIPKDNISFKTEWKIICLCSISLILFSISFYGLWFAKILILCFIILLYSILLGTSFISIIFILTKISLKNLHSFQISLYFAHNYIWLINVRSIFAVIFSLFISSILNIIALWGTCHLCSCIEHRHEYWPYRKRTIRMSQNII